MSFLDLYQGDQEQAAKIQPNEGTRLPSTFNENFNAAWSDGRMFGQSIARANARAGVLNDYISEIRQKTGQDLSKEFIPDAAGGGQTGVTDFSTANDRVAKLKQDYPDLDLAPLSDEEIDNRAITKAQAAHQTYEKLQSGEKTLGGSFGTGLGSLAAGVTDPINIVGLAIAPETAGVGILGAALRWGALAGVSQAAIEFSSDQFKEQVQPGYMESGGPGKEIAGAFLGGAVTGGGIKALGNVWSRVKTGQWPTSVRDAGNVLESEANVANTNPFPGVEGEVAHREALSKTIDDILAGRPINVDGIINQEFLERSRSMVQRLQTAEPGQPMALPVINRRAIELVAEHDSLTRRDAELASTIEKLPPGDASAADRLNRLQSVEQQIGEINPSEASRSPQLSGDPLRQQIKQQLPEVVARPSGEFDDFDLPIHHQGKNVGQIEFNVDGNRVKIQGGYIDSNVHGKGLGIAAYQRLADWALSTGRELHSDLGVSAQASRMYAALERRGYRVERDPDIEINHLGAASAPGRPAFRITPPLSKALSSVEREKLRELNERRDQILVDTNPEALKAAAAPIEARRQAEAERASVAARLEDIAQEHGNLQASTLPQMDLPALGQRERIPTGPKGQFEMDLNPPAAEPAAPIISTQGRERSRRRDDTAPQPPLQTAKEMSDTLTAPDHQDAIRADIDRERAMGDLKVPGVDENGNHTMVGVDAAMEQVDNYKKLAEQIQACANPVQEAAE